MPGVRLNFSGSGVSVSAGIRGASITSGRRGVYANVGIPGTGFSSRTKLSSGAPRTSRSTPTRMIEAPLQTMDVVLRLQDTGEVIVERADGGAVTRSELAKLREQKGDVVRQWLEQAVADLNKDYETCIGVHLGTPHPSNAVGLLVDSVVDDEPAPPNERRVGLIDRLLFRGKRIRLLNENSWQQYEEEVAAWNAHRDAILGRVENARLISEAAWQGNEKAMTYVLESRLAGIPWPRETSVNFDFSNDGAIDLDIDLPEIEDLPSKVAKAAERGIKVNFKPRSDIELRRDYLRLINGTMFRVIGEVLASLPTVRIVTASGYTQRTDKGTGSVVDDYVISVRADRERWQHIDFAHLSEIDPGEALGRFEIARATDRSANLKSIEPLNAR
jgi:hypothetical protein